MLYVVQERGKWGEERYFFTGGSYSVRCGRRNYAHACLNTSYPQLLDPPDSPDPGGTTGLGSMDDVGDKDDS